MKVDPKTVKVNIVPKYLDEVLLFDLMSTNYDKYGRGHMPLDDHWSVKIFVFMVFLYESLISCAFSLSFNMILTLTLQK